MNHAQKDVLMPARTIQVDAGLAKVLTACWARGWFTLASCRRRKSDGLAYILFEDTRGAVEFVVSVLGNSLGHTDPLLSLIGQMNGVSPIAGTRWQYASCYFRYAVEFPPEDIGLVLKRLTAARVKEIARR